MELNQHEVHVWSLNLSLSASLEKEKLALLDKDEQKRALQFHFPIHKTRFIASHAGLRQIAAQYLNEKPEQISISMLEFKKPYFTDHPDLSFNLSHSGDHALIAFARYQSIGVDIELIKDIYQPDLVKRYFHRQEIDAMNTLSDADKRAGFYRLWSRKEAVIKAIGKGMSVPLDSFAVSAMAITETVVCENTSWSLYAIAVPTEYMAALASSEPLTSIRYQYYFL